MKKKQKLLSKILIGGILLGIWGLTGCSFFANNINAPQEFSPIRLEKLEDNVDAVVEDYFKEKYGVEATVTYKNIAGGVFLGPDPSSVQYYLVTVNIAEEGVENEYYVEVHGREVEGQDELYVKKDAYYGKIIKERMEEWLDSYMCNTDIHEYYVLYNSTISNQFPSEFAINATAEEILDDVSSIEDNKDRPSLPLYLLIPEREHKEHNPIDIEFSEVRNYLIEQKSQLKISVLICEDDDYERQKNGDDSRINPIAEYEITGNN